MRAITLHQPWASLIAIGAKTFETRSFPPPAKLIGQRIAIHAAVRDPVKIYMEMYRANDPAWEPICNALDDAGFDGLNWSLLPLGAAVATAVLTGAYQLGDGGQVVQRRGTGPQYLTLKTDHFGDYTPGRWAWLLTDVQPLATPIPAKGKQGWWEWDEIHGG
ncbi:ASCH domain-containing protein [Magnetospirillum sp. XM-1]|uniref:ASCH domain-containing protein n=1 Tax=Magnetospirillum sp. XM-1 TaxID=1663591 RepID=UPI000837D394|nr:ASCH domain-containing protein [Magnetospirillum sp. XM-1]